LSEQVEISVITTVYNCENFIEESIKSILSQTYSEFEFIIVNDGSTDKTADIIRSFEDSRIIFIDNAKNVGVPVRSNSAIDIARGEYISIQDADDISLPFRLEKEIEILKSDKNLFCVNGYAIIIDERGKVISQWDHPSHDNNSMKVMIAEGKNPVINPSAMFKKYDFNKIGKYTTDKSIQLVHDLEFWGRCLFSGYKFFTLDTPIIKYRINNNGLTFGRSLEMKKNQQVLLSRWREKGLIL